MESDTPTHQHPEPRGSTSSPGAGAEPVQGHPTPNAVARRLRYFADAIKIEHTVFALPFAYVGMALAAHGWPGWHTAIWVTLALLGGRTAAMALNRLIDRRIDARNPRTASRHLPRGLLGPWEMGLGALLGLVLLFVAAAQLNRLCLELAPLAVVLLAGYHYTKR